MQQELVMASATLTEHRPEAPPGPHCVRTRVAMTSALEHQ